MQKSRYIAYVNPEFMAQCREKKRFNFSGFVNQALEKEFGITPQPQLTPAERQRKENAQRYRID